MKTLADLIISPLTTAIEADVSPDIEPKPDHHRNAGQASLYGAKTVAERSGNPHTRQRKGNKSKRAKKS